MSNTEVTADSLTDDQLILLRDHAEHIGNVRVAIDCCGLILGRRSRLVVGLLRERCASAYNRYADAINARAKAVR